MCHHEEILKWIFKKENNQHYQIYIDNKFNFDSLLM